LFTLLDSTVIPSLARRRICFYGIRLGFAPYSMALQERVVYNKLVGKKKKF
jgi:hypothetical protein